MEGFYLMAEPEAIHPDTLSDLCKTFQVSQKTYEYYNQYYNKNILPRIQRNYLAHLIASVEEIIDEKIKEDIKKKNTEDVSDEKVRDFFIILRTNPPPGKKAVAECQPKGAYIKYKPSKDFKELRIFIAHELGHVLRHYNIISGDDLENHANLFAFLAINGKNKFYQNKVKNLIYSDEIEIIRSIEKVHPIVECRQKDTNSSIK
jgi:Zn-dependent peptidase ImmA (M78 family)